MWSYAGYLTSYVLGCVFMFWCGAGWEKVGRKSSDIRRAIRRAFVQSLATCITSCVNECVRMFVGCSFSIRSAVQAVGPSDAKLSPSLKLKVRKYEIAFFVFFLYNFPWGNLINLVRNTHLFVLQFRILNRILSSFSVLGIILHHNKFHYRGQEVFLKHETESKKNSMNSGTARYFFYFFLFYFTEAGLWGHRWLVV
jgi:hypothetical protein